MIFVLLKPPPETQSTPKISQKKKKNRWIDKYHRFLGKSENKPIIHRRLIH